MQAIKTFSTILLCGVALLNITGCKPDANDNAATSAPTAAKATDKTPARAPVKMTISQTMGVDILKAMNANPKMNGHQISVGTTASTVILNGKVKNAAQKKLAETIARQKAKKSKVVNQITVSIQ